MNLIPSDNGFRALDKLWDNNVRFHLWTCVDKPGVRAEVFDRSYYTEDINDACLWLAKQV